MDTSAVSQGLLTGHGCREPSPFCYTVWGGYAATVIVNAAIGAAAGALGAVASPARLVSATGRLSQGASWGLGHSTVNFIGKAAAVGSKALIGASSSMLQTVTHNAVENSFYGAHYGLLEGAGMAALSGAFTGGASAAWSSRSVTYAFGTTWTKAAGWTGDVASIAGRTGWAVAQGTGLDKKAEDKSKDILHEQEQRFRSLEKMVGHSGVVGTLSVALQRNALYVNYGDGSANVMTCLSSCDPEINEPAVVSGAWYRYCVKSFKNFCPASEYYLEAETFDRYCSEEAIAAGGIGENESGDSGSDEKSDSDRDAHSEIDTGADARQVLEQADK
ncbi:hypothetical protein NM208_g2238 [Fusarium decemcellulare]|uniref:Uncharacterized protein n=1 Tax=Fusarium decemcellulare TaxID=57161 RepID=A0ACC1ST74_9HYPO|nr:hypothetical protein NM208_g2238 [Fusarium decemcellulare]